MSEHSVFVTESHTVSFAVRGDGSYKGETRHSGIDMNTRRMMYAVTPNPACDGTDHGDPAPAFSQPTCPGRLWISLGADLLFVSDWGNESVIN